MDPDLYTALPPDQKEEYKKTFHKPVNIEITRHIIDSCGNVWLFKDWEPLTIPDEWLSVTKKLEELNSIDQIIHPRICIDDSVPDGYARIGDQYFELPDAQICTSEECKPFDIEDLKSLFNTWEKLEPEMLNGDYLLTLAEKIRVEAMRKKIEEDMERRLKEVGNRNIMQFWRM